MAENDGLKLFYERQIGDKQRTIETPSEEIIKFNSCFIITIQ